MCYAMFMKVSCQSPNHNLKVRFMQMNNENFKLLLKKIHNTKINVRVLPRGPFPILPPPPLSHFISRHCYAVLSK